MNTIEEYYNHKCEKPSDIHEHLPTIKRYAEECEHITEMGVRDVVSTWALLAGSPKRMICIDIVDTVPIQEAERLAKEAGVDFTFIKEDTANPEFVIEETDLLFIDTWHMYEQLSKEFELHGNKAKKYIILHDTTLYGEVGDECDPPGTIIKVPRPRRGLWQAIEEFIAANPEWKVHERFHNNNGLTVLKRGE